MAGRTQRSWHRSARHFTMGGARPASGLQRRCGVALVPLPEIPGLRLDRVKAQVANVDVADSHGRRRRDSRIKRRRPMVELVAAAMRHGEAPLELTDARELS